MRCLTFIFDFQDGIWMPGQARHDETAVSLIKLICYITIGQIHGTVVIVMVVYTEREEAIRIISARRAAKREKEAYYNGEDDY